MNMSSILGRSYRDTLVRRNRLHRSEWGNWYFDALLGHPEAVMLSAIIEQVDVMHLHMTYDHLYRQERKQRLARRQR